MDYNIAHRDYLNSELEYRLNRATSDLAGRRRRRVLTRRRLTDDGLTWTKVR
jgi:hypothetical protein